MVTFRSFMTPHAINSELSYLRSGQQGLGCFGTTLLLCLMGELRTTAYYLGKLPEFPPSGWRPLINMLSWSD